MKDGKLSHFPYTAAVDITSVSTNLPLCTVSFYVSESSSDNFGERFNDVISFPPPSSFLTILYFSQVELCVNTVIS